MQDKNSGRCCLNVKLCLVVSLPGVKRGWLCPFCASFFCIFAPVTGYIPLQTGI